MSEEKRTTYIGEAEFERRKRLSGASEANAAEQDETNPFRVEEDELKNRGGRESSFEDFLRDEEAPAAFNVDDELTLSIAQERLAELIGYRDGVHTRRAEDDDDFNEYQDCDRILGPGTVVRINGKTCRLLIACPVIAPEFRDEAVFAENLAAAGDGGLGANAPGLRQKYNGNGADVGVNEDHPHNRNNVEIKRLELAIASYKPDGVLTDDEVQPITIVADEVDPEKPKPDIAPAPLDGPTDDNLTDDLTDDEPKEA